MEEVCVVWCVYVCVVCVCGMCVCVFIHQLHLPASSVIIDD